MQRIISSFTRLELRLVVFCATMVALGTFILAAFRSSDPLRSLPEDARLPEAVETVVSDSRGVATDGRVCLNSANEAALETLPGIGPARAKDILALREIKGGFSDIEELLEVSGLGEKSYLKLSPHITLTTVPVRTAAAMPAAPVAMAPDVVSTPRLSPESAPAKSSTKVALAPVNINTASAAELEALNGVGPALAGRIIEYRTQQGGFRSAGDLDSVKGIGPAILRKNAGMIVVR